MGGLIRYLYTLRDHEYKPTGKLLKQYFDVFNLSL